MGVKLHTQNAPDKSYDYNKGLYKALAEEPDIAQRIPPLANALVLTDPDLEDELKKRYLISSIKNKWNLPEQMPPLNTVFKKEDKVLNRYVESRAKISKVPGFAKNKLLGGDLIKKYRQMQPQNKDLLKKILLGASAVGGMVALGLLVSNPQKTEVSEPPNVVGEMDSVNKTYTQSPTKTEAKEIVTEALRRTGVVDEDTVRAMGKNNSQRANHSGTVYEHYADTYKSARYIERKRQDIGSDAFNTRQKEDYQALWGFEPPQDLNAKVKPTPDSRLGRAEADVRADIIATDGEDSTEKQSKALAYLQNKKTIDAINKGNSVYDPAQGKMVQRTYVNDLDQYNTSKIDQKFRKEAERANIEVAYQNPDSSTVLGDKFQQSQSRDKIVDIDHDLKSKSEPKSPEELRKKWFSLSVEEQSKYSRDKSKIPLNLQALYVDNELAKEVAPNLKDFGNDIINGNPHTRKEASKQLAIALQGVPMLELKRTEKKIQLLQDMNKGIDIFPQGDRQKTTAQVLADSKSFDNDPTNQRDFGLFGVGNKLTNPQAMGMKSDGGQLNSVQKTQQQQVWKSVHPDVKSTYIDAQLLKDATAGENFDDEILKGGKVSSALQNQITFALEDRYQNNEDTLIELRKYKEAEIDKAIAKGIAILPDFTSKNAEDTYVAADKKGGDKFDFDSIFEADKQSRKEVESTKPIDIFQDLGDYKHYKRSGSGNITIVKDKNGTVFKKSRGRYFVNGEQIKGRDENHILEKLADLFKFQEIDN